MNKNTLPNYNHMFDVAFSISSPHENWEDISAEDLLSALEKRVEGLRILQKFGTLDLDAFGFCDTYEEDI
jgi:hypothetical protein